jgi:hypothetical protein
MSATPKHPISPDTRGAHSLDRLVGRFGYRTVAAAIGELCLHGVPGLCCHSVGTIEHVTATGRLAVRHWNRVHIVPSKRVVAIYSPNIERSHGAENH